MLRRDRFERPATRFSESLLVSPGFAAACYNSATALRNKRELSDPGCAMPSSLEELRLGLAAESIAARLEAAENLARMGQEARPAAVDLVRACGDGQAEVREWAAAALEEMGPPDEADAAALAPLVASQETDVAYWAATLLGRLEGRAAAFIEPLAEAVNGHRHQHVRHRAAWALGKIAADIPAVRAALETAAGAEDPRLARLAVRALASLP